MSSHEEYNSPLVRHYFQSVPNMKSDDIRKTVSDFAATKGDILKKISESDQAVNAIVSICREVLTDKRNIEDVICDSDEAEDDKVRSVTMRNTKAKFRDRTQHLFMTKAPNKRFETIYRLKFKISVLMEALKSSGAPELSELLIKARNKLVEANLRLVIKKVGRWAGKGVPLMDLIQEGNIGLMVAADKYDIRRPTKFSTMAMYWINLFVSRIVINKSKIIRTPVHINNTINKVNRAIATYITQHGSRPDVLDLVGILKMPAEKMARSIEQTQNTPYIINDNNHFDEENHMSYIDSLPDPDYMEDKIINRLDHATIRKKIVECLENLTPRQEKVIRLRYGIGLEELDKPMEFHDIGDLCDISKKRAHDLHATVIKKMKKELLLREHWEELQ